MRELIIDSFAGGGGASLGIEMALGRSPDVAINHDADALAMHEVNHPQTLHLNSNIWQVNPDEVMPGRSIGLMWASPDCKHHSKAKGGKPLSRNIRDLAWVVVLWAKRRKPRVICLENVEEFRDWGPLCENDRPIPERKGETFAKWVGELKKLGYKVDWRELRACDFGAPTIRKRLFLVARCDGLPIVWPAPTHGNPKSEDVKSGKLLPWRAAAEIIDWSLPCHSIFLSKEEGRAVGVNRPLAEATMARIAKGVRRYVIDAAEPFVVTYGQQGGANRPSSVPMHTVTASRKDTNAIIVPVVAGCGGRAGQSRPRSGDEPLQTITAKADSVLAAVHLTKFSENSTGHLPDEPLHTVMAGAPRHGVVAAFLAQHNGGTCPGARPADEPVSTVTATGAQQAVVSAGLVSLKGADRRDSAPYAPHPTVLAQGTHSAEVRAFLVKYYGQGGQDQTPVDPLHTIPTKARFGLVMVHGEPYEIVDIGMRMLRPRELFRAQGFPDSYVIDRRPDGSRLTGTAAVRMCGNSVSPVMARALVAANYTPDLREVPPAQETDLPLFEAAE
jgi:DNA (cytosine-5)-methyltransferase 1